MSRQLVNSSLEREGEREGGKKEDREKEREP